MKTSLLAIPAAVLFAGGLAISSAQAADLGGDCCADLEERVAELEATTVRKGNKKVSLKISGFVSQAIMYFDDGDETNVYVGDPNGNTLASNFTFSGSAQINSEWSAGFQITIEARGADNTGQSQNNDNGVFASQIGLLVADWWIKSEQLGKISVGQQSQASDNAALLPDLSGTIIQSNYVMFTGNSMLTRNAGVAGAGGQTALVWGAWQACNTTQAGVAGDCNGTVLNNIRYDSPTIAGFTLSTSWGEDDFWDVALNYAGDLGDIKVKAVYAFSQMTDEGGNFGAAATLPGVGPNTQPWRTDTDFHQLGASALHVPTGLFIYGAYTWEEVDNATRARLNAATPAGVFSGNTSLPEVETWYVKAGIQTNLNSLGKTIFYGEYKNTEDGHGLFSLIDACANGLFGAAGPASCEVTGAEYEMWGLGVVQYIDSAAMQVWAKYNHNEIDVNAINGAGNVGVNLDDLDTFVVGGVIFF